MLGTIMNAPGCSPRHRVDAAKALDAFAGNGPEAQVAADRFQITINIGNDIERYRKSLSINPNDNTDPDDIDPEADHDSDDTDNLTPQGLLLAAIAARKPPAPGGGEGEP